MTTKPEATSTKETKDTKTSGSSSSKNKDLFVVSYDSAARTIRIGTLAIPTWILSFLAGALLVIVIQALINQSK